MDLNIIKEIGNIQGQLYCETGDSDNMIGFESESGQWIINPFKSECSRFDVNPIEYYGEENLNDFWNQIIFNKFRHGLGKSIKYR